MHLATVPGNQPHRNQEAYRTRIATESAVSNLIDRRFTSSKDGGGYPPDLARAYSSSLRAREPMISDLLALPNVVVLAEPGGGKSVVTKTAMAALLSRADILPVRISLLECNEERSVESLIDTVLDGVAFDASQKRYYLLDGIDEVPREVLDRRSREINDLIGQSRTAGVLATSRQAFYVANRDRLPAFHSVFHLLDFSNRDIEKYVTLNGVEHATFISETKRLAFFEEIRNPFNLSHAVSMYRKSGRLPATRTELLEFIIRSQLQTRPDVSGFRQQRALEQLAIAMEIAARNELTEEEAILVIRQSIHGITLEDARKLLDTLYTTILKRVEGGLSFQLASYGEYLAAESLATEPLERVKQVAFDQGGVPNYSWANTISYLAELSAEVRSYFCRWYPLWMNGVSPAALSPSQRDEVVRSTLRVLSSEKVYASDHPQVRLHRLSRLVTMNARLDLLGSSQSDDEVEKGNAVSLLGMAGSAEVIEQAIELVINRKNSLQLRHAGILALLDTHSNDTATRLLAALQQDDPLHLNIIDAIGTVATLEQLPIVLPELLRSNGMPASAYYRFQEMRSREAALTLLRYASDHISDVNDMRAEMYFGPAFDVVWEYFDQEVAGICSTLLIAIEERQFSVDRSGPVPRLFAGLRQLAPEHKDLILQRFFAEVWNCIDRDGATFYFSSSFIADLMTIRTARWLVETGRVDIIPAVVRWLDGEVRDYLAPYSGGMVQAQNAARATYLAEEAARKDEANFRIESLLKQLLARTELNGAIQDFYDLTKDHWPRLNSEYLLWLQREISTRLIQLNLPTRIVWAGNTVTFPAELLIMLDLITFYELTIQDAQPLIQTLILGREGQVVQYFKRNGMSNDCWDAALELLRNPPGGFVLVHVLQFIQNLNEFPHSIREALLARAEQDEDGGNPQISAFSLVAKQQPIEWLQQRVSDAQNPGIRYAAEDELIRRQHEPTLMAKLDAAIRDPTSLGEHYTINGNSRGWLFEITAPFTWDKLVVLRERGLRSELHGVVSQCTDVLVRMDRERAIAVFKSQIKVTPASWRIRQRAMILEQVQQLAIDEARSNPFDRVLTKLKFNTSSTRIKVWCEGINDEEIFRTLLERMSDLPLDIIVENVHGWPGLQQEQDPNIWLAQCNEAFIVMDGDNGRKLKKHKKPLTKMARDEATKLKGFPITFVVLQRYGIENYFTQAAIEAVVGRDLTSFFPIPEDTAIKTHLASTKKTMGWRIRNLAARVFNLEGPSLPSFYPKNKNKEVAKYLQPEDLRGTDLFEILEQIVAAAKLLQGDL